MSVTILPELDDKLDTFPVELDEEEPESYSERKPIKIICPACGQVIDAQEVTINVDEPFVFYSIPPTREGSYYFDTEKCIYCESKMEVHYEVE